VESVPRADNYAYAVSYVRALRSRLLSPEQYETLLKAKDEQEALRYLTETVYAERLTKLSGKQWDPIETDLAIFEDYYDILGELLRTRTTEATRQLLETTYVRQEFSCLKIIMRLVKAETIPEELAQLVTPVGRYTPERILRLLKTRDIRQLLEDIDDPKARTMAIENLEKYEKTNSTLPIEVAADKFHLSSLWDMASRLDNWDREPVQDIVGTEVDAANVNLILRSKNLGMSASALQDLVIPIRYRLDQEAELAFEVATAEEAMRVLSTGYYRSIISSVTTECERKRSILPLEIAMKKFFVERCSRVFIGFPFGVAPLLAFLNLKYLEGLDIRTLLLGKRDKMTAEALRHLLIMNAKPYD